jgi:imidazolonepropionase-like amidohydrolase
MHRRALVHRSAPLLAAVWFLAWSAGPSGPSPLAAQGGRWALTNARIQTVSNGVIERGVILIRDGLIQAVGPAVPIPADARVLDLEGRTVTPGLIDLASAIASTPASGSSESARAPGSPAAAAVGRPIGLDPARAIAAELRLPPADLKAAREAGITAVLIAANRGTFRGFSALVPTRDSAGQAEVIRSPVAVQVGFQPAQGGYPATLLGVIAYQRQTWYDAHRYALLIDRYRANPRGLTRPAFDPGLEALAPALRGAMPVFFEAATENEIRRAVRIGREFNLSLTVVGAGEGFRAVDALRGRSAVVSVNVPRSTESTGWSYRLARRETPDSVQADSLTRLALEGNAAALHRNGVRLALATSGTRPADFLGAVRRIVRAGLPEQAALEALTIRPAELIGLGSALGSIEPGKIANLVVTERGDLLADSARIREVFVDGIRYQVQAPPSRAGGGGTAPAQLGGSWLMTVTSPQGPMEVTFTVTQTGTSFTGQMASAMGTTPVDDGQITGKSVSWSTTITMGGQSIVLTFQGEVEGTRMTGTAVLGSFGSSTFTAEKRP